MDRNPTNFEKGILAWQVQNMIENEKRDEN